MAKLDTQEIINKIKKSSEYGVIALLVFIAIIMIIFLVRRPDIVVQEPKTIDIKLIPFPKDAEKEIKDALNGLIPLDQSHYQKDLLQRNLFSFREVLSKQALEKELADKLKRAQSLFDQANYQQAIDLCDEILQSDKNREPARLLKEKAQKALQPNTVSTLTTK